MPPDCTDCAFLLSSFFYVTAEQYLEVRGVLSTGNCNKHRSAPWIISCERLATGGSEYFGPFRPTVSTLPQYAEKALEMAAGVLPPEMKEKMLMIWNERKSAKKSAQPEWVDYTPEQVIQELY